MDDGRLPASDANRVGNFTLQRSFNGIIGRATTGFLVLVVPAFFVWLANSFPPAPAWPIWMSRIVVLLGLAVALCELSQFVFPTRITVDHERRLLTAERIQWRDATGRRGLLPRSVSIQIDEILDARVARDAWGRTRLVIETAQGALLAAGLPDADPLLRALLRHVPQHACAQCGYLLRGIRSPACPECGTATDSDRPSSAHTPTSAG